MIQEFEDYWGEVALIHYKIAGVFASHCTQFLILNARD